MRLDYYHTGDASQEVFSVDRVVIEPLPWPGDPTQAIDSSNLGKYLFEVRDAKTKQLLYSRGFASIYGEWETTDEAKTSSARFRSRCASLLRPRRQHRVEEARREERLSGHLDHDDRSGGPVCRSLEAVAPAPLITIQKTGDPETRSTS
jgi:hypothetical protein